MVCVACSRLGPDLCDDCRAWLTPGIDRVLEAGLLVRSAFRHEGPAQSLVHQFKYRGSDRAGWLLARAMASLIPGGATLVPVPRASWRHLQYGIDPAPDLARRLERLTGCALAPVFVAPGMSPRQAGRKRSDRLPAPLQLVKDPGSNVILIDDVLTTGRTLSAAREVLHSEGIHAESAITATARGD